MKEDKFNLICLSFLAGAAVMVIIMGIIVVALPTSSHESKAQKYDLKCVTEEMKQPLKECKEDK